MKRLVILTAGVFALSAAARADEVPASISNQSPEQAAMSEAITRLLSSRLGEDALWTKLIGRPKRFNEYLYVNVPQQAITLGRATFDDSVRFQVNQSVQWLENCNGTQELSRTVETTTELVDSSYNTEARNADSSHSHTVTLDAKVGSSLGSYVETSYSFNRTQQSSESTTTHTEQSGDKMIKETFSLTAAPGQSVAFQTNQVVLAGANSTFTAHAAVKSAVPLDFYVKTVGTLMPDLGVTGRFVTALDNSPKPGRPTADADLHIRDQVLRSPDGGFIFGFESRTGFWSVIDLNSSQPKSPARLWAPMLSNQCSGPQDFVMTKEGQLQSRCGNWVQWQSDNGPGNPCFYLTFVPEAPGELVCYTAPPEVRNRAITFLSGVVAARTQGDEIRPGLRHVKASLAQLLPGAPALQDVSFTGVFAGAIGVLGPVNCVITYNAKVKASGTGCTLDGLAQGSASTDLKKAKKRTPSGELASLSYCGPTNAFLQPYLARNPMAVGGN